MSVKEYRRPWNKTTWWLERPTWILFMVRELTAVFVGGYALLLLIMVSKANDAEAFKACVESLKSPLWVVVSFPTGTAWGSVLGIGYPRSKENGSVRIRVPPGDMRRKKACPNHSMETREDFCPGRG